MSEKVLETIEFLCKEAYHPLFSVQTEIIRNVLKQVEIKKGEEMINLLEEFNNLGI